MRETEREKTEGADGRRATGAERDARARGKDEGQRIDQAARHIDGRTDSRRYGNRQSEGLCSSLQVKHRGASSLRHKERDPGAGVPSCLGF